MYKVTTPTLFNIILGGRGEAVVVSGPTSAPKEVTKENKNVFRS